MEAEDYRALFKKKHDTLIGYGKNINMAMTEDRFMDVINELMPTSPRYSVSLVYVKTDGSLCTVDLRVFITDANSEAEALGIAMLHYEDEMKGYSLNNKVILKHN
tara:strand:+ start:1616 stop:1930 length:315 start_codon:yes stop_codon:yes gene_type:complete